MEKLRDCFTREKQVLLKSVNYFADRDFKRLENTIHALCKDSIEIYEKSKDKLILEVVRDVNFEPEKLFSIRVSYLIEHHIKDELIGQLQWNDIDLEKEVYNDIPYFSGDQFDYVSLLISQVTSSFQSPPLITPPTYFRSQNKG